MKYEAVQQSESPEGNAPEVDEGRKKLVKEWEDRILDSRQHWKRLGVYEQMRKNQEFAARGAEESWIKDGKYTVPILNRHINQTVSNLYAKNPTAVAKRRPKLFYKLWDGRADTLQMAMEGMAVGDPMAAAIVQEVLAVRQQELMLDRMAKTLEILWEYYVGEQAANFKQQLKAAVRRAKVSKVGYIKIGYQRLFEKRPEVTAQIEDVTAKIAGMQATLKDISEGEVDEQSARMEELKINLRELQEQETIFVREGLIFDFPRADEITIDKNCRHLKSFAGAEWISHDYHMTPDKIEATWGVDVKASYKKYRPENQKYDPYCNDAMAAVHEVYHKRDRHCFVIVEGWPDFVQQPYEQLKIERFFPVFPLVFNETEDDKNIYPPSDVELAKDIQNEYNRSREALREHRIAARPWWVDGAGLEPAEKNKISHHAAHEVVTLPSLGTNQKPADLLQAGPTAAIDPNLYETEMHFTDMLRCLGSQEANLGGTSDSTATESSIAENSRSVSNADNVDDLDEVLSEVAKAAGQIMLTELSKETVIEIVGPGAVWPDMPQTREEVAKDLILEIKVGSSGRPNAAAELANIGRAGPLLIQIPGVNPTPLGRRLGELVELDTEEMIADGLPSIQAMNAMMAKAAAAPSTGDPSTDPNAQGDQGGNNAPGPQQNENEPGGQPAYPAPAPVA